MKIKLIIIIVFIAGVFITGGIFAAEQQDEQPLQWYLLWNDEFDGTELDGSKWRVENAALNKNNELQYYTPEEVSVHDGLLTLRSSKKNRGGREYTSGLVETRGKFAQQYGRIEVRAKLPQGKGIWPAHWMLPASGKWPPEIDITEIIGHQPNVMHMTVHWGTSSDRKKRGDIFIGPDFSQDFHEFAVEWDKDAITWFVDGQQRLQVTEYVPQEPFFIILNTAVGGNWPGCPNSQTQFPQYHDIDYVRVYAQEIPGEYFLSVLSENGKINAEPYQFRYDAGTSVTLTAQAEIGYVFSSWSGDLEGAENPVNVLMDKHKKIRADFIKDINPPELLSLNKQVMSSSDETVDLTAENVVDGDMNTRWSSVFSDPQWIQIDLGGECLVEAMCLKWEAAFASEYEIQASDDAKIWRTVYVARNGQGATEQIMSLNVKTRYVALYLIKRALEFGYSLWEIEVYGREE